MAANCEPAKGDVTEHLNNLLKNSGPGYTLSLCPGEQYFLTAPLRFTAPNQEISTAGYPTGDTRAMLIVNGAGQTTAVSGTCAKCSGVKLRNVQVDGARRGAPIVRGEANIEMGGPVADQLIEYVRSFDPRGWSCLHVGQGFLNCNNVKVQYNDIGPAGSQEFQQWADGISIACRDSLVKGNKINNPTDGGIVLFGSPGTRVEENTIWVETQTLLGGINLVDVKPFGGDYKGVVVTNNHIVGGFASGAADGKAKGGNEYNAMIKVGVAIGPHIWFGNRYPDDASMGGLVTANQFTGAFGYAIAMSLVKDFTVENNALAGSTSFIGERGINCSLDTLPPPAPFVYVPDNVQGSTTQPGFQPIADAKSLVTCIVPPAGKAEWPYREAAAPDQIKLTSEAFGNLARPHSHRLDRNPLVFVLFAVAIVGSIFVQLWALRRCAVRLRSSHQRAEYHKRSAKGLELIHVHSA